MLLEIKALGLLVVNAFTFDSKIELIKSAINKDVKKLRLEAHLEMTISNKLLAVSILVIIESMNYLALEVLTCHDSLLHWSHKRSNQGPTENRANASIFNATIAVS